MHNHKTFVLVNDLVRRNAVEGVRVAAEGYVVTIKPPTRSGEQNAKLHAMLSDLARSDLTWAGKRRSLEEWKALIISGHAMATRQGGEVVPGIEGEFVAIRESSASMSVSRAASLIEYLQAFCASNGVELRETRYGGFDSNNEPSGDSHPPDDGSGDSSMPPEEPAAEQSAQESGTEAGASTEDALSNDEGQHSAEPAPASASIDGRVINLMEECRDKFLQLATDENLTREQRWGAVEKAKNAWKEALPENLPFVKACFEAAGRVVKIGPEIEADERATLDKMIDEVRP